MCASVERLYKVVVERLTECNKLSDVASKFSGLCSDAERVAYALSVLRDYDLLPNFDLSDERLKQENICVELRNRGNVCFQQHKDNEALLLYTQSIANSPVPPEYLTPGDSTQLCEKDLELITKKGSDHLSYAYANRSAVSFELGKYKHSLQDIKQAERLNYPNHLMHKLLLRKAKCLIKLGDESSAQRACMDAQEMLTRAPALSSQRREALELEIRTIADGIRNLVLDSGHLEVAKSNFEEVKLSFGQNRRIQCAADCIDIEHSEAMGRSIITTRDVTVGDVLLMEEPFAAVLLPHYFYTHCYNCFRRCRALIPCLRCSLVMFCSEECRKKSWETSHRFDCYIMSFMLSLEMRKLELLALRVILTAAARHRSLAEFCHWVKSVDEEHGELGFDENGQYVSENYRTVYHIVTNTEKRTVSDLFERSLIASYILEMLKTRTSFFSSSLSTSSSKDDMFKFVGGLILRHLQNLPCNAHEISEYVKSQQTDVYEQEEIGAAAYATLSLVNHSCDPNVVRIIHGSKNALVVIRPIRKGEQVLDNYGYHYAVDDLEERKKSLEKQYFFTCCCLACEQQWPLYHDLPSKEPTFCCPGCHSRMPKQAASVNATSCSACSREVNVGAIAQELEKLSDAAPSAIQMSLKQPDQHILNELSQHLEWLDRHVQRPWQLYNNCQEAIKHLWFCRSSLTN